MLHKNPNEKQEKLFPDEENNKTDTKQEVRVSTATPGLHLGSFFSDLFPLCSFQAMLSIAYLCHGCHAVMVCIALKGVTISTKTHTLS